MMPSSRSFLSEMTDYEKTTLKLRIDSFVSEHATHHRPMAMVSSGGTVVDLEVHSVRCMDNFSTGLRGAIAVEELLKRGYAVIHLWRQGSASPFARVVGQHLGLKQANHALDVERLGRLFAVDGLDDEEDDLVRSVLQESRDPFLTEPQSNNNMLPHYQQPSDEIRLHRDVVHSTRIHKALRERSVAMKENRLLTIQFRSVEDYLARLELISESLRDYQSLALLFLAAAVSDFYIPQSERAEHKIQSRDSDGLVLHLRPVPKAIGLLRTKWAPDAFVVSFKLETDMEVLRRKAAQAVERYGCHLVIGNLLQSRHDKVWILAPTDQRYKTPTNPLFWAMKEITKPRSSEPDSLESALMDFVIQNHFEYISWHFHGEGSGVASAEQAHQRLMERKRQVQRELILNRVKQGLLEVAGVFIALVLSYSINSALQRRVRGP